MMEPATRTPVVLLMFNRPAHVAAQLDFLRAHVRPERMFVVCDGPRSSHPEDQGKVDQCKALVAGIDWPCRVDTDYAEENMGCGGRVATGLTWAFTRSERLIVLEDDVRPDPSFFPYCDALLARYAEDERVMHVGGTVFHGKRVLSAHSFYFSRYMHCWGWAGWRRAWALYDHDMAFWPELKEEGWLLSFLDPMTAAYWTRFFDRVWSGEIDTWDVKWQYALWRHSGLATHPRVNLVSNVGMGDPDATHTTAREMRGIAYPPSGSLDFPLTAPPHVLRNFVADTLQERAMYEMLRRKVW
ncbi:MAG: glycosyltransferase [Rhodospirillum sp.]|nr:glycosyltransferase [Rhodospirillum sp.]MCF8490530.1 glycosyltransferase [Rhodospirillum sp.]MCF8502140.1 glycosyltransferase [Rhodospirillum sp.]